MSLSVGLMPNGPIGDVVDLAVLAEQLGCSRCWVYDEGIGTRDVYVTLAAIAARTQLLPLGPGITNPYVRHPGATATAMATLDELSGGRAFVGLGAGGALALGPLALARPRPLTAVAEMVDVLRRLFAGERVSHEGHAFSFSRAQLPYARPDIPIMLAGRGPKITELGARIADGFILSYIHKSLLSDHVRTLRSGAGDRRFVVTYCTMLATTEAELEVARAQLTFRLVDSPQAVKDLIGMTPEDTEAIRSSLSEGGPALAARHIKDEWIGEFVVTGTAAECAAALRALLEDNDIDEFQLPVLGGVGGAELIERTAAMFSPPSA